MIKSVKFKLNIDQFSKIALFLAIFFLLIRLGGTVEVPNIKPSEFLLLISFIATMDSFISRKNVNISALDFISKKILFWITLFYASLIIGTFSSIIIKGLEALPLSYILVEYARIFIASMFFLLVIYHGYNNKKYLQSLCLAFLSPLVVVLITRFQDLVKYLKMQEGGGRLEGFMGDPNYFASLGIVAFSLLLALSITSNLNTKFKAAGIVCSIGIFSTLLWSGSRSGWIGATIAIIAIGLLYIRFSLTKILNTANYILLILIITSMGFNVLNSEQKTAMVSRIGINFNSPSNTNLILTTETSQSLNSQEFFLLHAQDRLNIWAQSVAFFINSPTGYGPGYSKIINLRSNGEHRVAHSIIFESMLTGGILLLGLLSLVLWNLLKFGAKIKKPDHFWMGIYAAILGVLASSMFLDSLYLRWLWILAAILISYTPLLKEKEVEEKDLN